MSSVSSNSIGQVINARAATPKSGSKAFACHLRIQDAEHRQVARSVWHSVTGISDITIEGILVELNTYKVLNKAGTTRLGMELLRAVERHVAEAAKIEAGASIKDEKTALVKRKH